MSSTVRNIANIIKLKSKTSRYSPGVSDDEVSAGAILPQCISCGVRTYIRSIIYVPLVYRYYDGRNGTNINRGTVVCTLIGSCYVK